MAPDTSHLGTLHGALAFLLSTYPCPHVGTLALAHVTMLACACAREREREGGFMGGCTNARCLLLRMLRVLRVLRVGRWALVAGLKLALRCLLHGHNSRCYCC